MYLQKVILCFGDSNTHGSNPAAGTEQGEPARYPWDERYPVVLQEMLGNGYRVLEEGMPGRSTVFEDPVEEGMNGLSYIRPCMLSHAPLDLLVVMLGTNDAKERFSATPRVIAKGLSRLLEKAIQTPAWRTKPNILIIAPVPVHPVYMQREIGKSLGAGCCEKTNMLAEEYKIVAQNVGAGFLDAGEFAHVHQADGVHLTRLAHNNIAQAVYDYVQSIYWL